MKNLTIITSVIKTSTNPLVFCDRSVFGHEERYKHTIKTLISVRLNSPNTYIVFIEGSDIPIEWENIIKCNVDFYLNISIYF